MPFKTMFLITVISIFIVSCFIGCGPETKLALKFDPEKTAVYNVTQETSKEVRFDQPSIDKTKVDVVKSTIAMTFQQNVVEISDKGEAVIDINIEALKMYSRGKKGVNYDFDSSRTQDAKNPLTNLIGQSYRIKVDSLGKVEVIDVKKARAATDAPEAQSLLMDEMIIERHQLTALPDVETLTADKGIQWKKVVSTPKSALDAKAYEKLYTLKQIKKDAQKTLAVITMEAAQTDKVPQGGIQGKGLGVMAGVFDSTDEYKGELIFDITSGKLVRYTEKLETKHVAAEEAKEGDPTKGPDVLTMTFISSYAIEEVK